MRTELSWLLTAAGVTTLLSCNRPREAQQLDPITSLPANAVLDEAFAARCAAILDGRDPRADARVAIVAGERRLLSWYRGTISVRLEAPGFETCEPLQVNVTPEGLPKLPLGYDRTSCVGPHELQACFEANYRYGTNFNREMVRLAPGATSRSCKPALRT